MPSGMERTSDERQTEPVLQLLFSETTALVHRLKHLTRHFHQREAGTSDWRSILRSLAHQGPQTVPYLARTRNVSRQHIQVQVNQLASDGYVEFVDNPAHQRSRLVQISLSGKD